GDNLTNIATPVISGTGETGDTIALFDGTTLVGSTTVGLDGTWSVATAALANGTHVLTANQTDALGNPSALSSALALTIDQTLPTVSFPTLSVAPNSAATAIGIAAPSDIDNAQSSLTITVAALPSNGTVTLDGTTAVTLGEALSTSQLSGLE